MIESVDRFFITFLSTMPDKLQKSPYLKVPPQSIEAEGALLGSIMLRPDAINDVADIIGAQSFYSEKHRIIFRAMMDLFQKSSPIDLLSLSSCLRDKSQLDQIGGASYLTELVSVVPSAANIQHYAEIVQKKISDAQSHRMRRRHQPSWLR
jgi:replicative DNA helicase